MVRAYSDHRIGKHRNIGKRCMKYHFKLKILEVRSVKLVCIDEASIVNMDNNYQDAENPTHKLHPKDLSQTQISCG
jgi:hypothetical protein